MKTGHTLITGVGRRAGLHLARSFLTRGMGVVGTYRQQHPALAELKALGAELHRCDFTNPEDITNLVSIVRNQHASLRGIIHNASLWLSDDCELPPHELIDTLFRVHVTAPYQINNTLSPLLLQHAGDYADIIHIGDYVTARGSKKHMAYAASKAAQDNLTLSFAQKLAPKVKVNSIAPALLAFHDSDPEDYRTKALSKSLLGKEGGLEELEHTVQYLFNSGYITGRVLALDGGRHLR